MIKKTLYLSLLVGMLFACKPAFTGVEGVKGNGNLEGPLPSKEIKSDYKKVSKKQARIYKKEMKKRAKRLGTTKKR